MKQFAMKPEAGLAVVEVAVVPAKEAAAPLEMQRPVPVGSHWVHPLTAVPPVVKVHPEQVVAVPDSQNPGAQVVTVLALVHVPDPIAPVKLAGHCVRVPEAL